MTKSTEELKKEKREIELKMENALKNGKTTNYISLRSRLDSINLHIQTQTQKQKKAHSDEYSIPRL